MLDEQRLNQSKELEDHQSIGQLLKTAREAMGFSYEDIAAQLNLRVTLIQEIEKDNFEGISALTYVRGYLKNYASKVGVDEAKVMNLLDQQTNDPTVQLQSFSRKTVRQANDKKFTFISYAVLFSLIALGLTWWIQRQWEHSTIDFSKPPVEELVATPFIQKDMVQSANEVLIKPAVHQTLTDDSSTTVVESDTEITQNLPFRNVKTISQLSFHLDGDCWMQVEDSEGKTLVYGLKKQGTELSVEGTPPFFLIMGAPEMVQLKHDGEFIDLSDYQDGRTARLQIPVM